VTERQYDNPKFVEDVIRDATLILRTIPGVLGFDLEVEALESIHGHNAWASHHENFS
jgi:GTP cyclohydrolase I